MRVDGWERRLKLVVEKHLELPSQFGVSDCYLIPDDGVEAVLGEHMYPGARRYKSEAGAARQLRKHGFETVEDAFRARFPETPPSLAQRGDIGVIERDGVVSGGLFTQLGFMTRGTGAVVFLDPREAKMAFRVD